MKYAKMQNGKPFPFVGVLVKGGKVNRNPTESDILAAGYLPIQETEEPTAKVGFVKSSKWVQTDSTIVKKWTVKRDMRPLSQSAVTSKLIAQQINTLSVDDNTALRMQSFYPEWESGATYAAGYKVQHGGNLWRTIQAHTAQPGWEPENAPSLWEQINETHEGTIDDAIPYNGNMALVNGKYYTQNDTIYLCTRDTQIPVYNALADLVGIYVEEV